VYDIAKELGIETAEALAKLNELGEYVKSGSSTIAPPVANKLRAAYPNAKPKEEAPKVEKAPAKPKATKAAAKTEATEEAPAAEAAPAEPAAPDTPSIPLTPLPPSPDFPSSVVWE
jgi:translation initiation factor IF-2